MTRRAPVLTLCAWLVLVASGCGPRPDVRVLADERARPVLEQVVALYEMRTGERLRVAYVSRGRMDVMLVSGRDEVVVGEIAQIGERPTSTGIDRESVVPIGSPGGGPPVGVALRSRASARGPARRFWRFLQEHEAREVLASAGWIPPGQARGGP